MAQLVGDAYVRIFADSRALKNAIERDMRLAAKGAGDEGARSLMDSFANTIRAEADRRLRGVQIDLARAIVDEDFDKQLKASGLAVTDFVDQMQKDFDRFYAKGYFGKGADGLREFEGAAQSLDRWAKNAVIMEELERLTDEMERNEKAARDQARAWQTYAKNLQATERAWEDNIAAWRKVEAEQNAAFEKAARDQARAWETYGKNLLAAEAMADEGTEAQDRHTAAVRRNAIAARFGWSEWRRYNEERLRSLDILDENESGMRRFSHTIDRSVILLNRHSESTGRMFGAGSRSEFLNFIGRTVGLMSRIPNLVVAGFGKLVTFASDAVDQFKDLKEIGVPSMQAVGTIGARALSALLPTIISIVIGFGAMSHLMPALISLFGLLAGAVAAVVGAIGIGLVAGLLALVPLVGVLGAGIGVLVLSMSGLGDASERVTKKLKPLSDFFKEFREFAANDFVNEIARSFGGLMSILNGLRPLISEVNRVFGDILSRFVALSKSPLMEPFFKAWGESLPRILYDLGDGIVTLGAALTAFFKPILPYAEKLADAFAVAMQTFLDWSSSAEGQNTIAEWMRQAWEMAQSLWQSFKNIASILGSILGMGAEGPGADFLQWLEDSTGKLAEFLKTPEGEEALRQFFSDVKEAMVGIKDVLAIVIERMGEVDWDQAVQDALNFLSAVETVANGFSKFMQFMYDAVLVFRTQAGPLITAFEILFNLAFGDTIPNAIQTAGTAMTGFYNLYVGPALAWIMEAMSKLMAHWGLLLVTLGNIPGFGWATDAGNKMIDAAGKADDLADSIRQIPVQKTINIKADIAQALANVESMKRALKMIPDENVNVFVKRVNTALRGVDYGVQLAAGGVFDSATRATIGEAGREAVVPLERPLSMVDPAVRDLSAFAQGLIQPRPVAQGSSVNITIEPGAIVFPGQVRDPEIAAQAFVDRLAASFRV